MTAPRPPSTEDFRAFFENRLRQLPPRGELIWMSNQIPVEALEASYPLGIFPWPGEDPDLFPWVNPRTRGILPLADFHLGRSTRRHLKQAGYRVGFDQAFDRVVEACHEAHEPESWIHPRMRAAYLEAHRRGFAHSVEVWLGDRLVGGLYGVDSGVFFSGESMFHHEPNAGKAAVAALVTRLAARGDTFLDIQQLTPHMRAMGACEVPRAAFLAMIPPGRMEKSRKIF